MSLLISTLIIFVLQQDQQSVITSQITEKLVTVVSHCTSCNLHSSSVTDRVIQCSGDPTTATFRALLLGSTNENQVIIDSIKDWIKLGGNITINGLTVKLDSNCDILIKSLQDEHCTIETPSTSTSKSSGPNVAAIVIPILIVVILIAVIALILVLYLYKRRNKKDQDSYMNFDEPENSGTARLSMNLYDSSGSRRNYNNPIYGEISDEKELPEENFEVENY